MQRDIKFRAKIKGDAGVYEVLCLDWLNLKANIYRACGYEWVSFKKIEAFLQYTGLKDKNGKEIYEGDIVRVSEPNTDKHESFVYVGDVRYEHNRFYVHCSKYHPEFRQHNYEVIGNVWENKELLNEKG